MLLRIKQKHFLKHKANNKVINNIKITTRKKIKKLTREADNKRLTEFFISNCKNIGLPEPFCEYIPQELKEITGRRFRLDFAFPDIKLGIEIDGAIWIPTRGHSSGTGITRDMNKLNALVESGWWLLRFDGSYSGGTYKKIDFKQIFRVYKRLSINNDLE